jgi:hypothetical protein
METPPKRHMTPLIALAGAALLCLALWSYQEGRPVALAASLAGMALLCVPAWIFRPAS